MLLVVWGGWLLIFHLFKKQKPESFFLGVPLGVILYLALINLLGRWIEPETVFWLCGVMVMLIGTVSARFNLKLPYLDALRSNLPYFFLFVAMFLYPAAIVRPRMTHHERRRCIETCH